MLSYKQNKKYFREWAEACRAQGWRSTADKDFHRKKWHAALNLPESHTHWNTHHFSRWISGTAHLRNQIDIRDRERESLVWMIERLRAAFQILLGHDYAKALMIGFRDTNDLDNFPTEEPLEHPRDEESGEVDPRDDGKLRDLVNLRNTLKNRIGRVIQRIRDGKMEPGPDCPAFGDLSQADIIAALINTQPLQAKPARKKYVLDDSAKFHGRDGMEYGTADVPATSRPPVTPAPSKPKPKPTPPPAAAAPTPQPAARKYCMH